MKKYIYLCFVLIPISNLLAKDYISYLDENVSENTAVIVIDMYECEHVKVAGFKSTSEYISQIVKKTESRSGLIICIMQDPAAGDKRKSPDSVIPCRVKNYSKFISLDKSNYDAFKKTALANILHENNVKNLIIVGSYTDMCITETLRSALNNNFNVSLFFGAVTGAAHNQAVGGLEYYIRQEAVLFHQLIERFEHHIKNNSLKVICAPSRDSDSEERDHHGFSFDMSSLKDIVHN